MKTLIAIDPGATGAVASGRVIDHDIVRAAVWTCPKTRVAMFDIIALVKNNAAGESIYGYIERAQATFATGRRPCPQCGMSGAGSRSSFTYGQNYGAWQMALTAAGISYETVLPKRWMREIAPLPKGRKERKAAIAARMEKRYPYLKVTKRNADALAMLTVFGETVLIEAVPF